MMQPATHLGIHHGLCGAPVSLAEGEAVVRFTTTPDMAADHRGLVHGGFVFGLADHAAMLAVNHPFVVLGAAETRFLAPVRVGEIVEATARRTAQSGRKHTLDVQATSHGRTVFTGTFTAFVLDQHVLGDAPETAKGEGA
jgi:acyl-coenzyme A thioesterase PaaI-like protein